MNSYIVKEYVVITYDVEAESRDEVQRIIDDAYDSSIRHNFPDETSGLFNPNMRIDWDTKKTTIQDFSSWNPRPLETRVLPSRRKEEEE